MFCYDAAGRGAHFWVVSNGGELAITSRAFHRAVWCREPVRSNAGPAALPRLIVRREVVGIVADVPRAGASRPVIIAMCAFVAVLGDTVVPLRQSAGAAVIPLEVG